MAVEANSLVYAPLPDYIDIDVIPRRSATSRLFNLGRDTLEEAVRCSYSIATATVTASRGKVFVSYEQKRWYL